MLQQGFAALRTSYEALIIFEVFKDVVGRFEERISFGRLKDVCIDQYLLDQIVDRMEFLSRYIEGHSHSDLYAGTKPTPAMLFAEIETFEEIRRRQKSLKRDERARASTITAPAVAPASSKLAEGERDTKADSSKGRPTPRPS